MTKKNARPSQAESGANEQSYYADLSASAQRARLLDALKIAPVTTLEARRNLEVLMPAARIFELRAEGYIIDTLRVMQETEAGILHNVAKYVLRGRRDE